MPALPPETTLPATSRHAATRRPVLGALAVALVAGGLLAGCSGGSSTSVSCRGADCRATVTGAPVEVDQPDANQSTRSARSTKRRPPRDNDGVDFGVTAMGPGWVDVEDDGRVTRVQQGGTFVEDGSTVRLESSDGRTAVFTFRRR
ncbi:hypothetical protein [Actinomycetospora lemnae]|uniref:Uncharacterized protein n=1 Tax=Actinomycetospora lemnae TaxID=3019891 RepID=A0ABT5SP66_9PSEU|nr:hypothetical protein [Actinomycetospora sp. DW7H6]MDD7964628.1 hypothetical protein [Actinomycetospora sp. DW7H6]